MPVRPCPPSRSDLAESIARGGHLRAVYQPILDLVTGHVTGYEGLSRPCGPADGLSPAELFGGTLPSTLRDELETLARRTIVQGSADVRAAGDLLFINCSPSVLLHAGEVARLRHLLDGHASLEPQHVVIEVTEDPRPIDEASLASVVREIQAEGFQVALDDLAAGGNGLGRVARFRPDWVKLDRSLIEGLDRDAERRQLVGFLARMSCEIGASVVAEGIVTMDELAAVIRLGVSHGQGFGLGKPGIRPHHSGEALLTTVRGATIAHGHTLRRNPLTKLPDRIACEQALQAVFAQGRAAEVAVGLVDLRHLTQLNADKGRWRPSDPAVGFCPGRAWFRAG